MTNWRSELIDQALTARQHSYAPYSGVMVGAALLCASGAVFGGANIENASYPAGICAERTAFAQALFAEEREFIAVAVVGGLAHIPPADYFYPCGICRQWMAEFCQGDFIIMAAKGINDFQEQTLAVLLPASFGPMQMNDKKTLFP
ncbi:MAG: cytidine deaminase [Clostridiales bacterium]|nr:cytidine deaminase [Clostridiales bacterium]